MKGFQGKNFPGLAHSQRWFFGLASLLPIFVLWVSLSLFGGSIRIHAKIGQISKSDLTYLKDFYFLDNSDEIKLIEYKMQYSFFSNKTIRALLFEVPFDYFENCLYPNREHLPWLKLEARNQSFELQEKTKFAFSDLKFYNMSGDTGTSERLNSQVMRYIEFNGAKELVLDKGTNEPDSVRSAVPMLICCLFVSIFLICIAIACGNKERKKWS